MQMPPTSVPFRGCLEPPVFLRGEATGEIDYFVTKVLPKQ